MKKNLILFSLFLFSLIVQSQIQCEDIVIETTKDAVAIDEKTYIQCTHKFGQGVDWEIFEVDGSNKIRECYSNNTYTILMRNQKVIFGRICV